MRVLRVLGHSAEDATERFGFLLEGLSRCATARGSPSDWIDS
jgi:hypothetical protein